MVQTAPFQLLRPVWADDPEFSIRHHVRHTTVAAPGGPEQLRAVAARLFALPLNRRHPLWEEWLLDGLEGGRWAILSKIHHCMVVAFRTPQLLVQTVTTNVPGPRCPLYVLGRRLTALHPYVPIGDSVRISVAILSYFDTVSFGVTADYDSSADLNVFTEGIECGLVELHAG